MFWQQKFIGVPVIPLTKRIEIYPNNVHLSSLLAKDLGKTYKFIYTVSIMTKEQRLNPNLFLTPQRINMVSLRRSILSNVLAYDRKYIKLIKFDHKLATFHFDIDTWMKDALNNVNPKTEFSKFSRIFRFRVRLPHMILQNQVMGYFEKFLTRHFKDYMEKKRKPAKWFKYLIPEELRKKTRTKVSNMFEYNYDMQWNTMTLHLKTIYIMALLFAIGSITYHASKTKVQGSQQMKFAKNVRANIPKFNLRKFEKFVRTRNI